MIMIGYINNVAEHELHVWRLRRSHWRSEIALGGHIAGPMMQQIVYNRTRIAVAFGEQAVGVEYLV